MLGGAWPPTTCADARHDDSAAVANLIGYLREGYKPDRDLIVTLTADEEGGTANGVEWLLANHRELIDAEFGLNEGGGGQMKDGRRIANTVQATEKVFQSFRLEVKNPGGHSSLPVPDNAIYRLAEGLVRLSRHQFPVRLNEVTRLFFERSAATVPEPEASDRRAIAKNEKDAAAAQRKIAAAVGGVAEAHVEALERRERLRVDAAGAIGAAVERRVAEDDGMAVGTGADVEREAAGAVGDGALHREERVLDEVGARRRNVPRVAGLIAGAFGKRLGDAAMGDQDKRASGLGREPGGVEQGAISPSVQRRLDHRRRSGGSGKAGSYQRRRSPFVDTVRRSGDEAQVGPHYAAVTPG